MHTISKLMPVSLNKSYKETDIGVEAEVTVFAFLQQLHGLPHNERSENGSERQTQSVITGEREKRKIEFLSSSG